MKADEILSDFPEKNDYPLFLPPKPVSAVRQYGDESCFDDSAFFLSLPESGRLKSSGSKKLSGRLKKRRSKKLSERLKKPERFLCFHYKLTIPTKGCGGVEFLYSSYSDIGGRELNEDAYLASRRGSRYLFAVADGLGGHMCGELASELAVSEAARLFDCDESDGIGVGETNAGTMRSGANEADAIGADEADAVDAKKDGARNINAKEIGAAGVGGADGFDPVGAVMSAGERILQMQAGTGINMKTTMAVAYISGGQLTLAHVGDSRIYVFGGGGILYQSTDHSASQLAVSVGEITAEQLRTHEDRNILTRALGMSERLRVDSVSLPCRQIDAVLLCTDGFWEYVYETEMLDTLSHAASPDAWLGEMRGLLRERMPTDGDNNTAITIMKRG